MHRSLFVGLGLVIGASGVASLAQLGPDANGDGCVDLRDYAEVQRGLTGPDCVPRKAVSFWVELTPGPFGMGSAIISLPTGVVITDVRTSRTLGDFSGRIQFTQMGSGETKYKTTEGTSFTTGIAFDFPGFELEWIDEGLKDPVEIFLSGYTTCD